MSDEILLSVYNLNEDNSSDDNINDDNLNDDNKNNNKNSNLKNKILNSLNKFFFIYSNYIHIFAYIYLFLPCLLTNIFIIEKIKEYYLKRFLYIIFNVIFLLTFFSFLKIINTSPGIQKKENNITYEEFLKYNPFIKIKNKKIYLKYCKSCKIIRRVRTFHCKYCKKCILKHDHHCFILGICIGKNNYFYFVIYIIFLTIYCIEISLINILFIKDYGLKFNKLFSDEIKYIEILNLILLFLSLFFFINLIFFFFQHIYYISKNITTRESIKYKDILDENDKGCKTNFEYFFNNNNEEEIDKKYNNIINKIILSK